MVAAGCCDDDGIIRFLHSRQPPPQLALGDLGHENNRISVLFEQRADSGKHTYLQCSLGNPWKSEMLQFFYIFAVH
jgi:hypothetical protein